MLQEFVGRGPLHRVPHQHAVQEALERGGDLRGRADRRGGKSEGGASSEAAQLQPPSQPPPPFTLCTFFSLGGRLSRIIFMAFNGGSLKYGGSPSTISITITPRDQISTCTGEEGCLWGSWVG